jgi:hypothetical protein
MESTVPLHDALSAVQAFTGQHVAADGTPGLIADSRLFTTMPAHEYHGDRDALSCSLMKPLLVSPAHFQAALVTCDKSTDAKDFGSLVHLLLLQPHLVSQELAVYPGVADRTKGFAEFQARHPQKLVVDEPTFAAGRRLAQKVADTTYKGRKLGLFIEESLTEATIYFTEPTTGLRMRVRIDAYHPDITFDLKTSRHALARAFARDAIDMDYDMQSYMYSLARCLYEGQERPKPFVFLVAESMSPYSVNILEAGQNFLGNGLAKFEFCAGAFKGCTDSGYWPDLSSVGVVDIEHWQQFSVSVQRSQA